MLDAYTSPWVTGLDVIEALQKSKQCFESCPAADSSTATCNAEPLLSIMHA